MSEAFEIIFRSAGRKAICPADPHYPHGVALDLSEGRVFCQVDLPYPAAEVGAWCIQCKWCDLQAVVTAAGRVDDPISVKLACRKKEAA